MVKRTAVAMMVIFVGSNVAHAQSCGCEVSDRKEAAYDLLLQFSDDAQGNRERAKLDALHAPWGLPTNTTGDAQGELLLYQDGYIINYDADLRTPIWACYRLTANDLVMTRSRTECFRRDPRLPDDAAAFCGDYAEPIFDRGHLVPSADMRRSEADMVNTYLFSNMTPQHGAFNRRVWKYLEEHGRYLAETWGEVYIITGCIFDRDNVSGRDADADAQRMRSNECVLGVNDRVAIPSAYFKVFIFASDDDENSIESIAFILEHVNASPPKAEFDAHMLQNDVAVSIDEVESRAGLDLLPDLADGWEATVEAIDTTSLWRAEEFE